MLGWARVTLRDRNLALPREEWDDLGVKLRLGENYLDRVGGDMVFRTPGMRPDQTIRRWTRPVRAAAL